MPAIMLESGPNSIEYCLAFDLRRVFPVGKKMVPRNVRVNESYDVSQKCRFYGISVPSSKWWAFSS